MLTATLAQAKVQLSELLNKVEAGEEVVVTRRGRPVAQIRAVPKSSSRCRSKSSQNAVRGCRPWIARVTRSSASCATKAIDRTIVACGTSTHRSSCRPSLPTLIAETTSPAVVDFLARLPPHDWAISHWVRVEFAALLARYVRLRKFATEQTVEWDSTFEAMATKCFMVLPPDAADFSLAKSYVSVYQTGLRGPDALHLAIAKNHGATVFYSLDKQLLAAARSFGMAVNRGISLPGYAN